MSGKITQEQLKEFLCTDLVSVKLEGAIAIEPQLVLNMSDSRLSVKGFAVTVNGEACKADGFDGLIILLKDKGIGSDGFLLKELGDGSQSVEEYNNRKDFDKLNMAGILRRYPQADECEMTLPANDVTLSDEEAERTLKEATEWARKYAESSYLNISEEERAKLPDFDTLYGSIIEECGAFRKKNAKKIEMRDGHAFFCDEFAHGKTKYTAPMALWHMYHAADDTFQFAYTLQKLRESKNADAPDCALDKIPALKDALIGTKITFCWHCTASGTPVKLLRFKLTEGVRGWLLQHENDYELSEGFGDLALYKGEKILFSSCMHEHFHVDLAN